MGCHFLLQGIFLTQGSNLGLPHYRQTLYHLSHQGSPTKQQQTHTNTEKDPICCRATKAMRHTCSGTCAPREQKPCATTGEQRLLTAARQSPHTAVKTQHNQTSIIKNLKILYKNFKEMFYKRAQRSFIRLKKQDKDISGGPLAKTPHSQCRGPGFNPCSGK